MHHLSAHHALGASLASVALLSGTVAVALGWVSPGTLPQFRAAGDTPPVSHLSPPATVRVSTLPAATQ